MTKSCSSIILAGLKGNSGKTLLSLGLTASFYKQGKKITSFKKGPDYIDAAWLELASGKICYNLDAFLMGSENVVQRFKKEEAESEVVIVEGNRGLYDGYTIEGTYSTAELSKLLGIPVILIVDCTKSTRTVAASVLGCQHFDPDVEIKGVILNRIAGKRHQSIITSVIEERCKLPVLGAIPRIKDFSFPERHMGLVPPYELPDAQKIVDAAAEIAESYIDVKAIYKLALKEVSVKSSVNKEEITSTVADKNINASSTDTSSGIRIGYIKDSAFWFYYEDNLEALRDLGAELVECDSLKQKKLPKIDALYIGGGFPETHAEVLSSNKGFRESVKQAALKGLPIYAECGGLIYLGEKLIFNNQTYPMTGVLPLTLDLKKKPQGHGYTILKVDKPNLYYSENQELCGHEFHYSKVIDFKETKDLKTIFSIEKGYGLDGERDGIIYKNVFATYSHMHALGTKEWASGFFNQAVKYSKKVF